MQTRATDDAQDVQAYDAPADYINCTAAAKIQVASTRVATGTEECVLLRLDTLVIEQDAGSPGSVGARFCR